MGHKDPTYVVFDGDNDKWAFAYMKGWNKSEKVDFDFRDAHDLDNMTSQAQNEAYVKGQLRERMKKSHCVVVLVGPKTKFLYKYVRWEIELAQEMDLPIVAVNLNKKNGQDDDLCPALLKDQCVVHVPFGAVAIKRALDGWPAEYGGLTKAARDQGARRYKDLEPQ